MAEQESKSGFSLPWVNVVALLAAAGGIFTMIPTLDSTRPPDPGGDWKVIFGMQNVDSRLWQDPFEEVLKAVAEPAAKEEEASHSRDEFLASMQVKQGSHKETKLWVMFAMMNSGPHADARERRLRSRTAIVEGLSSSGFSPVDASHIGYLLLPWPAKSSTLLDEWALPEEAKKVAESEGKNLPPIAEKTEGGEKKVAFPYEWFERRRDDEEKRVVVIYVDEDACRDRPFTRLAWLSEQLNLATDRSAPTPAAPPSSNRRIETTVLGPATSTVLERMVREGEEMKRAAPREAGSGAARDHAAVGSAEEEQARLRAEFIRAELREVQIFCPTATASDGALVPIEAQKWKKATKDWQAEKVAAEKGREVWMKSDLPPLDLPKPHDARVTDWVEESIVSAFSGHGLLFQRTVPTDSKIVWETIRELQRRGINPTRWRSNPYDAERLEEPGPRDNCRNSVAIISELDTFYGRALPTAFREQCDLADFTKLDLENRQLSAPWIHNYRYLRGLDGRLPGDEKDKKSGDSSSKEEQKQHPGARPDGHDQTDSLLRLAAQLQSDDRKQRALGKPGFRAIGILGSDIYDKLLILRALRPMFPGVVFFTHTLDAELAQPEEWKATHNLVVISGFGLRLHDLWQRNIPPFRDGSQTAVYLGTLVAAGEISHDDPAGPDEASRHPLQKIIDVPRVFEIGRNGALDLSVNTVGAVWTKRGMSNAQLEEKDAGGSLITRIHPLRTDLRQWWSFYVLHSTILGTWPVPLSLGLCALFSLVFIVLFYRALVLVRTETLLQEDDDAGEYFIVTWLKKIVPRERFGGQALHRICGMTVTPWWKLLNRWFTLSTPIMSVAAALLAVLVVTIGYRWQWTYGEPFAWFAGLSIWPGVAIRVFALVLAIHFVFRSYCRVLRSDSEIFERFKLGRNRHECASATEPDRHWRHTFAPWTVPLKMEHRPAGLDPALPFQDKSFIAGDLWCQYIWRGWWPYRLVRVVALTTLFLFTTWCAFAAFDCGLPPSPTRSGLAAAMDRGSMSLLLIAAVFLTLFVVDALWLNSSFIRLFTSGLTRWPGDVLRRVPGSEVLEESEIAEDLDLRLIATRTEAIGEFVLYPFVIVALLIVSRAPYFDNWGWTNGLILILAALLGIAVVSALRIRAAAEEARQAALSRLRTAHAVASAETGMDAPLKVRVLNEMIARITAVHEGAFAPFSHQPIIKALLFPAGGIGVWELVMRVLNR